MPLWQMAKQFVPPVMKDFVKYLCRDKYLYYFGEAASFAEAEEKCLLGGYTASNIIDQVDSATQKVRKGEALYEQDGICFYEVNNNYELLAALLYAKACLGRLSVLDFGGALGSTYFRYRKLLEEIEATWCVVEQKHYIDRGRERVPEIPFYYTMDEALESPDCPNVLLCSGVLQYLEGPYCWFSEMMAKGFDYIILDETAFNTDETAKNKVMLQHVPASIYKATYPVNLLGQDELRTLIIQAGYEIVWEWVYRGGQIPIKIGFGFEDTVDKGLLLKKKARE